MPPQRSDLLQGEHIRGPVFSGRGEAYATFARDHRSQTRPADLLAAERDYRESVDVLSALQREGAIEGTDLTSLKDARRQLAKVRQDLADPGGPPGDQPRGSGLDIPLSPSAGRRIFCRAGRG